MSPANATPQLPSLRQLKLLPIRGIVGYAARAAARAQHLYLAADGANVESVRRAIRVAECWVAGRDQPAVAGINLKKAICNALGSHAESAAFAAGHLLQVVDAARMHGHPSSDELVLRFSQMVVEAAHDACFFEPFQPWCVRDFFDIQRLTGPTRYPQLGEYVDVSSAGPLGPVQWREPPAVVEELPGQSEPPRRKLDALERLELIELRQISASCAHDSA